MEYLLHLFHSRVCNRIHNLKEVVHSHFNALRCLTGVGNYNEFKASLFISLHALNCVMIVLKMNIYASNFRVLQFFACLGLAKNTNDIFLYYIW